MKKIELHCGECGELFEKSLSEYNRQIKNGRQKDRFFCSRSCTGKAIKSNLGANLGDTTGLLRGYNKADEFSPFRLCFKSVRYRSREKGFEHDLDLQFLKDLWEKQDGKCAVTGIPLVLENKITNPNFSASLDRVDSSKWYIKENVHFVSTTVNFAKNKFSLETLEEFIDLIKKCGVEQSGSSAAS